MLTLIANPRAGRRAKPSTLTANAAASYGELSDSIELCLHPRDGKAHFFTLRLDPNEARAFARFILESRHASAPARDSKPA